MNSSSTPSVFDEVVSALEPTLGSVAPFMLTRLLLRARIFDRATMTVSDFQRALPRVKAGLGEALKPDELRVVVGRMEAVVQRRQQSETSKH